MSEHWKNTSIDLITEKINGQVATEMWKDIPGYEGLCQASTFGRIRSLSTKGEFKVKAKSTRRLQILKQKYAPKTGYLYVGLTGRNGNRKTFLVHRLIGLTFIDNPENKREINHKFGDKKDNRVAFIEWATPSENQKHAVSTGLIVHKNGEDSAHALLNNKQVLEIFNSLKPPKDLAILYNVAIHVIYQIKNGKNWSEITGKYYVAKKARMDKTIIIEIFNSQLSNKEIREKYNISREYIWSIKAGKVWGNLTKSLSAW